MQKEKLPKKLKSEVREYVAVQRASKDAGNAANRQKTKLRNAIKAHWAENDLPIGSFVRCDGIDIKYEANESAKLPTEEILKMYEDEEITRDQLVRLLNVDRTQAKNILGGDVVADIEVKEVGKTVDIRVSETPIDEIDEEFVGVARKVRMRSKPKARKRIGGSGKVAATPKRKVRRKIKVSK